MNKQKEVALVVREGRAVSRRATVCYLKCPVFNRKHKKGKCDPYIGVHTGNRNCPDVALSRQLHQSYYKYFQRDLLELRETVLKELKQNKITMIYQIDNVSKEIKIIHIYISIFQLFNSKISIIWRLFIYLPIYLSIPVCLSVYLSIYLSKMLESTII